MRLIVTHEQPDFDALASLALARLLFPGAVATAQGSLSPALDAFLRLYRDVLELRDGHDIDLAQVRELIVVDTADAGRIGAFAALVGRVPITLYDHHAEPADGIVAAHGLREPVGATVTLLTRELMARDVAIPPAVASLALLGIHEDTGSLRYDLTKPDDYRVAAHLLASGANLELVRRFTREPPEPEQQAFRVAVLEHARPVTVAGRAVTVATFRYPRYVAGVSGVASELLDAEPVDAALVVVGMGGKTLAFARGTERFDVGAALADALGGGGHAGAAFGRTALSPEEATERVLQALAAHATGVLRARDLMSAPVTTVPADATIEEAHARLQRRGYNGMPVLDPGGALAGVVSRRDLERALRHGLGANRVAGLVSRALVSATPDTGLDELEALVVRHDVGRVPILADGRLVGIVTRSDLLAARHRAPAADAPAARMLERLPGHARAALEAAARVAGGAALYLVGGTVRDALLDAGSRDLDMAVTGITAHELGARLREALGGTLLCYEAFATCTLTLANGLALDLATAREERYDSPGALPVVRPSSIRKDLARRDFSVNAMALRVHPGPPELIDPFGGARDLQAKQLRVLHPLSFVEDPTRILRGARLAGRLGLRFEAHTAAAVQAALPHAVNGDVSRARLRAELQLTLAEPRVAPALQRLDELGVLQAVFGLRLDLPLVASLDALRRAEPVADEAYVLALLLASEPAAASAHVERFNWPRRLLALRDRLAAVLQAPSVLDRELEELEPTARVLVRAAGGERAAQLLRTLQATPRRRLRGSDVLGLGLAPGPAVGRVLDEVARARSDQRVHTFEDELELAKRLIREIDL